MRRWLKKFAGQRVADTSNNLHPVLGHRLDTLIDRSWSGHGDSREASAHGGKLQPPLSPIAEQPTPEHTTQLRLLHDSGTPGTTSTRLKVLPSSEAEQAKAVQPNLARASMSTPSLAGLANAGSCGCASSDQHPVPLLHRARSSSPLTRRQLLGSQDSASSIHCKPSPPGALASPEPAVNVGMATEVATGSPSGGITAAAAAGSSECPSTEAEAGAGPSGLLQPPPALPRLKVADMLANAEEGLPHDSLSPTVSLLSVQLRSASNSLVRTSGGSQGHARVSALSHALSASHSRESSARGSAHGRGPSREPSARGATSREVSARADGCGRLGVGPTQDRAAGALPALGVATAAAVAAAAAQASQAGSWTGRVTTYALPVPCEEQDGHGDLARAGERERRWHAAVTAAPAQLQRHVAVTTAVPHGCADRSGRRKAGGMEVVSPSALNAASEAALADSSVLVGDCELATALASAGRANTGSGNVCPGDSTRTAPVEMGLAPGAAALLGSVPQESEADPRGLPCRRPEPSLACSGPSRPALLVEAAAAPSGPRVGGISAGGSITGAEALALAEAMPAPRDELSEAEAKAWQDWFQRRWRTVRRRAFVQGLGLRSLWKVSSPTDRGEPPAIDLLVDDYVALPAYRSRSLHRHHTSHHVGGKQLGCRAGSSDGLPRDPSLSTMLLGEVAEVT